MKNRNIFKSFSPSESNKHAFEGGSYSIIMTAIVLTILIVLNIFVSALPSTLTKLDISSSKLYSITSNTKVVANSLADDVTIYWIVQSGQEDEIIENLLDKYDSLSDKITVEVKNPDIYPTFAEQYTDQTISNNSLVVESGDRSRYIAYDEIYITESNMYSYSYTTSFDGEGAITSAIDYVTKDELPKAYILEGHGESTLPSNFSSQIEKDNIETESLSLLTVDEIPEDADCIIIYAPASDISSEEQVMLSDYVSSGGKLLVMSGPAVDTPLTNLDTILSEYGVYTQEGIVVEEDRDHYAFNTPYVIIPDMAESDITNSLIEENYYALMPIAGPLEVSGSTTATVTPLLTTTESSFSKTAGYSLSTYEKEDDDIDGPFTLAVLIEDTSDGQIVWFSSSVFLDDSNNAYSSGANSDMAMNALASLIGESEAMAIRSKSLNYNYLTISDSTSSLLKTLMIGVFPLGYMAIGLGITISRRRIKNESL